MTTIAWDGQNLAADGLIHSNGTIEEMEFEKIKVVGGSVFASAGDISYFQPCIDWYLSTELLPSTYPVPSDVKFVFWVWDSGIMREFTNGHPIEIQAPAALGSGYQFALAAMDAFTGMKDAPVEHDQAGWAVQIACMRDVYSGGKIRSLNLYNLGKGKEDDKKNSTE